MGNVRFRGGFTKQQLLAGVENRVGTKTVSGLRQLDPAFDVWAERITRRLAEPRGPLGLGTLQPARVG